MKIRTGFVSNSSSSSFIIDRGCEDAIPIYNKNQGYFEEWTSTDIINWVKSIVKRESKRNNRGMTNDFIEENIKIGTIKELREELDLEYWYPNRCLSNNTDFVIYDTCDNLISDAVAKKIVNKFGIYNYVTHMG